MNWKAELKRHKNEDRIAIYFEKNTDWNNKIKKQQGAKWSKTLQAWHLPDTIENRKKYKLEPELPSTNIIEDIEKFKFWLQSKRYSENTIKTYTEALRTFLIFHKEKDITKITNEDVIFFNNAYILKNNYSASYQNQIVIFSIWALLSAVSSLESNSKRMFSTGMPPSDLMLRPTF